MAESGFCPEFHGEEALPFIIPYGRQRPARSQRRVAARVRVAGIPGSGERHPHPAGPPNLGYCLVPGPPAAQVPSPVVREVHCARFHKATRSLA